MTACLLPSSHIPHRSDDDDDDDDDDRARRTKRVFFPFFLSFFLSQSSRLSKSSILIVVVIKPLTVYRNCDVRFHFRLPNACSFLTSTCTPVGKVRFVREYACFCNFFLVCNTRVYVISL